MISVVIPALNEEAAIAETVIEVRNALEASGLGPYEIIVVDDGSSDATGRLAAEAGARLVSHPHNVGYGKSLKDGILAARHDTIVITDADRTYPIASIPDLLREYRRGFDMVVGARMGEHYRESIVKAPLRSALRAVVEFTANRKIPDINSGLRVFSRATASRYFSHLCDTFSFTTSMTLAYMMNSRFVHYVPIDYHERAGRTKVRLMRDSLRTMQYIIEAATYFNPLKIFTFFAFICLCFAGVSIVAAVALQLFSLFLLGVGSILLSVLVLALGLLAVLLKQIMDSDRVAPEADSAPPSS
jgi:glycosyltransferase involved in cell wall biosynthesis